jgi:hypothetical protein
MTTARIMKVAEFGHRDRVVLAAGSSPARASRLLGMR